MVPMEIRSSTPTPVLIELFGYVDDQSEIMFNQYGLCFILIFRSQITDHPVLDLWEAAVAGPLRLRCNEYLLSAAAETVLCESS